MVPPHPPHPVHHPHAAMYHHAAAHQQQQQNQQGGYQGYPQQQPRFGLPHQPPPHVMQQHPIPRAVVAGPHNHHPASHNYNMSAAAAAAAVRPPPPPRHFHPHPHHHGNSMAPMPPPLHHHPHHQLHHPHYPAYNNNNNHRGYIMPPHGRQAAATTVSKPPPIRPFATSTTEIVQGAPPPSVPTIISGSAPMTMLQPSIAVVEPRASAVPPTPTTSKQVPNTRLEASAMVSKDEATTKVACAAKERDLEVGQVPDVALCPQQGATTAAAVKPPLEVLTGEDVTVPPPPPLRAPQPWYSTTTQVVVQTAQKSVSVPPQATKPRISVMSPITMCFDRMLGAGTYLFVSALELSGMWYALRLVMYTQPAFGLLIFPLAEYIKTPGAHAPTMHQYQPKKRGPLVKKVLPLNTSNNICAKRASEGDNDAGPNPFDELADDLDLERLVILQMAMQRNQHGNQFHPLGTTSITESKFDIESNQLQPKREVSRIITEGFFWREYPGCEQVLYNHMHKYYEISAIQKNYKVQQFFNNVLVEEVRKAALDGGFAIDPDFCDKKLRDRIRCFYKTHLQNAKKRLATLQKHSDSIENQCLVAVFIRCVRQPDLTFEDSLAMATTATTASDQENSATVATSKKRRLDKVEKLKRSVVQHELTTANTAGGATVAAKDMAVLQHTGPNARVTTDGNQ
jgi:hypothetical protein